MAQAKRDPNRVPTLIGVSNADDSTPIRVYVDPTTRRLYVDASISGLATAVTDNEAVDAADTGNLAMGTDNTNYQILHTDSSGDLQVDVLTMPSVAVTNGGLTELAAAINASSQMDVNIAATITVPVSGTFWQATQPVSIAATVGVDVSDEATRLLGVVYGSQGAQLQQKVTTNDLIVTLDGESVAVTGTFWQTTQPVSGTFWQATQPISAASLPLPTGAATEATLLTIDTDTGNIVTSVQLLDNLVLLEDAAHVTADPGIQMLAVRDDTLNARSGAENDYEPLHTDANGALWTVLVAETTKVIGTVNQGTSPWVTNAVGTIADDATTPGNPVMVGGFAVSPDGTTPGAVAEADVARFRTDLNRRLLVNEDHPGWWSYHLNTSTAQTDTAVAADPGDGFQLVITDIQFSNGAATAINMFLEEGASTIWGPIYLEAINGRGYVWKGKKHVTASTALTITTSSSTAHSVEILGYIQAV